MRSKSRAHSIVAKGTTPLIRKQVPQHKPPSPKGSALHGVVTLHASLSLLASSTPIPMAPRKMTATTMLIHIMTLSPSHGEGGGQRTAEAMIAM
jgi:hypothetical protein